VGWEPVANGGLVPINIRSSVRLVLSQSQLGRTSAPRLPQAEQTNCRLKIRLDENEAPRVLRIKRLSYSLKKGNSLVRFSFFGNSSPRSMWTPRRQGAGAQDVIDTSSARPL
jgi:hypothetical protein